MAPRTILDGFHFGEGPRWHEGALWFSDMHGHRVVRTDLDGDSETIVEMHDDEPSGLGWLPDGRLLVVAMETQRLMRLDPEGLVTHGDLSSLAKGSINDMIVAADGTAYVGDMGYRIHEGGDRQPGATILVRPDGSVDIAAGDLQSPNGHILTDDGRTLIVAESGGSRLTAFDVADDGTLDGRRTYAELTATRDGNPTFAPPDGICLDAEGAVWVADPINARVSRVIEGGEVTDVITFDDVIPVACVLGGPGRRTLLMCVAADWKREVVLAARTGRIDALEVAVPGAGRP